MTIQKLEMKWIGVAPLIMHAGNLSDPLSKWSKAIKSITAKKNNKTDADHEEMSRLEFLGGLYMGNDGPVVPADNVEACLVNGAMKKSCGPKAKAGIFVQEHSSLIYDGPRDAAELYLDERFRSRVSAKVQKNRVIRTRPIFQNWSIIVKLDFEDTLLNRSQVVDFAKIAGAIVGLGDWRPRHGRFTVEV